MGAKRPLANGCLAQGPCERCGGPPAAASYDPRMPTAVNEPTAILVNGEARPLPSDATIAGLLAELGLAQAPCAVELNRTVVPRRRHGEQAIAPGDAIEIVTLVGGG